MNTNAANTYIDGLSNHSITGNTVVYLRVQRLPLSPVLLVRSQLHHRPLAGR